MLNVQNISHQFAHKPVLQDVSFTVDVGEVLCLLGPSGCGKTTCLRLIAGLEEVQRGAISLGNIHFANEGSSLAAEERGIGFVLQDFALFPHMTVLENVCFGLNKLAKEAKLKRAEDHLIAVGLWDRRLAFPHQLSGGEQQRVALARALAPEPGLMLMDEPFSGLDVITRRGVRSQTVALLKGRGVPIVMVTHDPDEALAVGDRIAVFNEGRLVQIGAPKTVKSNPVNEFVSMLFNG